MQSGPAGPIQDRQQTQDQQTEPPQRAGRREWAALGVLVLGVLLLAVDGTVLSLALPALSEGLAPSGVQLLWIGDAYSFALAGLLVTMGSLGDRIGRKRLLLLGAAGFGAASVLAAYAPTAEALIAARVLLGVAGATIMPSTLSLIRNLFTDPRQRTTAIAVWAVAATAGAAGGPLLGGFLLEHFWWGSVFLINVPVMVLLLVFGAWLLPESRDPHPGPFDLPSSALSLLAIVPVVYALKEIAAHGWSVGAVAAAGLGIAAGVIFVRRQQRLDAPMIDVALFRRRAFSGAVLTSAVAIFALTGGLFFGSLHLQLVAGYSPLQAGLRELPVTGGALLAAALVGVLLARLGRSRLISTGLVLAAGGMLLLAVGAASSYLVFGTALGLIGFGIGFALVLTTDAVVSAVPPEKAGAASAVSETAYEMGTALGIAVLGSVVTAAYRASLVVPPGLPDGVRAAAQDSLIAALDQAGRLPGAVADALATAARGAFVDAVQLTCVTAAVILTVAAVLAWRLIDSRPVSVGGGQDHHPR